MSIAAKAFDIPPADAPVLDEQDAAILDSIGRHYARYGEYEKALRIMLMLREYGGATDTRAANRIIDLAYRSGDDAVYFAFVEAYPRAAIRALGPLRLALYHLKRGNRKRSLEMFKKHGA